MTAPTAQLIWPSSYCLSYPDKPENEITKENVLFSIERQFSKGKHIVCVEGEEGIGKTTVLRQFTEKHPSITFCTFINPIAGAYSVEDAFFQDLYSQIYWYVNKNEVPATTIIDNESYTQLLFALKREKAKFKIPFFYFVVDGLEYLSEEVINKVIALLPVGDPSIKVVLSLDSSLINTKSGQINIGNVPLHTFTQDEAARIFSPVPVSPDELQRLWQTGNHGLPGKLTDFRRKIIEDELTVKQFLDQLDQYSELHEMDWKKLDKFNDELLNKIAAFASIDDRVYTVESLSKILNIDTSVIEQSISRVSFITISSSKEINFTSISARNYFGKKLGRYKSYIISQNIEFLIKNQDDVESLIRLPKYYASDDDWEGVIKILSEDYFPKLINTSKTLAAATASVRIGYHAAKRMGNDNKMISFSLYGSLVENIEGLHIWDSIIEAKIELGDYESAVALANSALLKEDRLSLLLRIAKIKKRKKEQVEEALIEQINQLYEIVDFKNLGDKSIDIARDLFYVNPKLALDLIKDTSSRQDENINDWLLARLTLAAIESKARFNSEEITGLMKNAKVREVTSTLSHLFSDYHYDQIRSELSSIKGEKERALLIRIWIVSNRSSPHLGSAIEYALDQLIALSSKDIPGAGLLPDLVDPIYLINDKNIVEQLITKALALRDDAKKLGNSTDYFKFIASIIRAKISYSYDQAMGLFFSLEKDVDEITDKITRAECLAIMNNCLYEINESLNRKNHAYLPQMVNSKLKNLVIDICDATAYHYENLSEIITYLSKYDFLFAVDVCQRANTITARDRLTTLCLTEYCSENIERLSHDFVNNTYTLIREPEAREYCIKTMLEELREHEVKAFNKRLISFLVAEIRNINSLSKRCYALCVFIQVLSDLDDKTDSLIEGQKKVLSDTWTAIDSEVVRIEVGYLIASTLAETDKELATSYLQNSDKVRDGIWPDSLNTVSIYTSYVILLIKAFSGLIKGHNYTDKHLAELEVLINNIPSAPDRVQLWSNLALHAHNKGDLNLREYLFTRHIKPAFDGITDKHEQGKILEECGHLFFVSNQLTTLNLITNLQSTVKESTIRNIIALILYIQVPGDPYEEDTLRDKISYEDIQLVFILIPHLEVDLNIYSTISTIINITVTRSFPGPQRDTIRESLKKLINDKLPNRDYVKHPGYKIIALAQLIKIEKDIKKQEQSLDQLIQDIESDVKNSSDRAFIYVVLSELIPSLKVTKYSRSSFLQKALPIIESLNYGLEFVQRMTFVCETIHQSNPKLWKQKIQDAFNQTVKKYYAPNVLGIQRRLIDNAYKYDPDLAKTLVSQLDTEEAREEHRKRTYLSRHFETLQLKKQLIDDTTQADSKPSLMVAKTCEKLLSSLNSGLIAPKKAVNLRNLLDHAIKLPISRSFPIYDYYIQNIIKRQEGSSDIKKFIDPVFDSISTLCRVIEILVQKYKSSSADFDSKIDLSKARQKIFKAGERDLALRYIQDFLNNNISSYVKICDPYFGKHDLEIIKSILAVTNNIEIQILTGPEGDGNTEIDVSEAYVDYWRTISEQKAPSTRISVVKFHKTNISPIHDRWILLEKTGLHLGTSLNGLGTSRASQISELSFEEKLAVERDVFDDLFSGKKREENDQKIICFTFGL